jgi:4-carboxymuconolactone decarboxylase
MQQPESARRAHRLAGGTCGFAQTLVQPVSSQSWEQQMEAAMRYLRVHHLAMLVVSAVVLGAHPGAAQASESSPTMESNMPSDIDPQSGFRLPLPKREDLDEAGKKTYDRAMTPGATLAGLQGPAGIRFYSPKTSPHLEALNRYLRFEAGLSPRIREIAILVVAREMDSQFEWVAHQLQALKDGVPPDVIDVIKHRRSTEGLDPADALVIALGRQIWRDHKVTSDTFAKAKEIFGPHKLVDLVLLMGNYAGTAALLATVDMQLHAGKKPLLPIP